MGGGTWVGWVYEGRRFGHCIFGAIHKEASVAHVGAGRVGDGHRLLDAFVFDGANGVNVGAADGLSSGCRIWL